MHFSNHEIQSQVARLDLSATRKFKASFESASRRDLSAVAGVVGRVLRVDHDCQPEWLSLPQARRLAWCIGPSGLKSMVGKPHFQILLDLGIKRDRIEANLRKGQIWKLVVLPDAGCRLATWEGLFIMIQKHFGKKVASKLDSWNVGLRSDPFPIRPEVIKLRGEAVVRENPEHELHMTPERYLAEEDTLENARLFLWHSAGVNDQFTGTGLCKTDAGLDGDDEYLTENRAIATIPGHVIIDLSVSLPV